MENREDTISRSYMTQRFWNYLLDCEEENDETAAQVFADCIDELIDAPPVPPQVAHGSPCDLCRYTPPSSGDGKPCAICPAEAKIGGM